MLSVKTNKDVSEFKQDFMGGFGLKESISILIGAVIGTIIIIALILFSNLPMMICPYFAMPFVAIPIINAFYHKDGMGFMAHLKKTRRMNKGSAYIFRSTETTDNYNKYLNERKKEIENKSDDKFEKTIKKLIILGIITAIVLIGVIVTLLIIKFK